MEVKERMNENSPKCKLRVEQGIKGIRRNTFFRRFFFHRRRDSNPRPCDVEVSIQPSAFFDPKSFWKVCLATNEWKHKCLDSDEFATNSFLRGLGGIIGTNRNSSGAATLSTTTFSLMTLSQIPKMTLTITFSVHRLLPFHCCVERRHAGCRYAECLYAECRGATLIDV
jgi:hypothetical protein